MMIQLEQVRETYFYKEHFGIVNFLNIFRVFYMLSNIPKEAENNPFAIYMDQSSAIRGFSAAFGIDYEEMAVRFYNLFV